MSPRTWIRPASLALALALPIVVGCDVDDHKTATGAKEVPADTRGPIDPGLNNAGGPGHETPKSEPGAAKNP